MVIKKKKKNVWKFKIKIRKIDYAFHAELKFIFKILITPIAGKLFEKYVLYVFDEEISVSEPLKKYINIRI